MTLNKEHVEQLNRKAQQLNAERQRSIGMKESARQAYEKAVFLYEQKYGVKLDDTNLQQEYNTVSTKMQEEYDELNKMILSIESGEYKAQHQPSVPLVETIRQENSGVVHQPTQPVQPQVQQQAQQALMQQPQQQFASPTPPTAQQFQQQAPVQQSFNPQQFNVPQQPVQQTGAQQEDVSEQAFTPQGWGTPQKDLNQNFQNIMDGSNNSGTRFGQ